MKIQKAITVTSMVAIILFLAACKKDDLSIEQVVFFGNTVEINASVTEDHPDIATVKARIYVPVGFPEEGWKWEEYVLATSKYRNGKFKLRFRPTVPDRFLRTIPLEGIYLSDPKAKWAKVDIKAYDKHGGPIGSFSIYGDTHALELMYSDRSYTETGVTSYGLEFDCTYKKGWNITYLEYRKRFTQEYQDKHFTWKLARPVP